MKKGIAYLFILLFVFGIGAISPANASSTVDVDSLEAGDLIRSESFTAVYYYGADGFRYVFPNDKCYFTWYDDFDDVKWISDADMTTVQIGGNVTYRPGALMLKINSDPKTYAVASGGTLRWVKTEDIAIDLYGSDWNTKIHDVADGFFSNYEIGSEIEFSSSFSPSGEEASAYSINADKDLEEATEVTVTGSGFSSDSVSVDAGTAVRWINEDDENHSATADDKAWGSGTLTPDEHFARYFDETGTFTYYDRYGSATGTIIVE
jgi:plastocyanin